MIAQHYMDKLVHIVPWQFHYMDCRELSNSRSGSIEEAAPFGPVCSLAIATQRRGPHDSPIAFHGASVSTISPSKICTVPSVAEARRARGPGRTRRHPASPGFDDAYVSSQVQQLEHRRAVPASTKSRHIRRRARHIRSVLCQCIRRLATHHRQGVRAGTPHEAVPRPVQRTGAERREGGRAPSRKAH
jgi:hypothetical protein